MLWAIPLGIFVYLVDVILLTPLNLLGQYAVSGVWLSTITGGLQFILRPLMYFQGWLDVPMAYNAIGWCFSVFVGWLLYTFIKFVFSAFRGVNPQLDSVASVSENEGEVRDSKGRIISSSSHSGRSVVNYRRKRRFF